MGFNNFESFRVEKTDQRNINQQVMSLYPFIIKNESFIAGGALRNIFLGDLDPVINNCRDIDVYFYTKESYDNMRERLVKSLDFELNYSHQHCIGFTHTPTKIKIELISKMFGSPLEVLRTFDFTIVQCALFAYDDRYHILHHHQTPAHQCAKRLIFTDGHKITNADRFFNRLVKYCGYGYLPDLNVKSQLFDSIKHTPVYSLTDISTIDTYAPIPVVPTLFNGGLVTGSFSVAP